MQPLKGKVEIRLVDDHASFDELSRFRYNIYVKLMNRKQQYANHRTQTIKEPLDKQGTNFAAFLDGAIIGCIRGNRFSDASADTYRELYRIDDWFSWPHSEMTFTTKLMFLPEYQRTSFPLRLMLHYGEHYAYASGSKIDFLDCNEHLVSLFGRLGYVSYCGWVSHAEYGRVLPMCCPADQIRRLRDIQSPLHSIAAKFHQNDIYGGDRLARNLMSRSEAELCV